MLAAAGGALPCAAAPAAPNANISANDTVRPVRIGFGFNRKAFFRGSLCADMSSVIDLPSTAPERNKIVFRLTVKGVFLRAPSGDQPIILFRCVSRACSQGTGSRRSRRVTHPQFTLKVTPLREVPAGVATVTVLTPVTTPFAAVAEIAQFAPTLVPPVLTVTPLQVTPPPDIATPVAPARLVPVMVTGTVVLREPEVGNIAVTFTKFVVSVAVLLAVFESVTPAGGATVTTFDIELAPPSRIAPCPSVDKLARNVYVAVPPAGSVTLPVRVELPVPVAVQDAPAPAVEQVQPLVVLTVSSGTLPIVGRVSVSVAPDTVCVPLLVTTTV